MTPDQLKEFSKKLKINDSVILREYVQLVFLKELYSHKYSENIFFKGGTAIRLIFGGDRFSEDLDFSVMGTLTAFDQFISSFFTKLSKLYGWNIKKRKTIAGATYLLSIKEENKGYGLFINLDFSFREKVLQPTKSVIDTIYPVIFTSFVNHLSMDEMFAEKIRATMTRNKGRDIYDMWFLLSKGVSISNELVLAKLDYYDMVKFDKNLLIEKIKNFGKEQFIQDLRPFVPINQRNDLADFYDFVIEFLTQKMK